MYFIYIIQTRTHTFSVKQRSAWKEFDRPRERERERKIEWKILHSKRKGTCSVFRYNRMHGRKTCRKRTPSLPLICGYSVLSLVYNMHVYGNNIGLYGVHTHTSTCTQQAVNFNIQLVAVMFGLVEKVNVTRELYLCARLRMCVCVLAFLCVVRMCIASYTYMKETLFNLFEYYYD